MIAFAGLTGRASATVVSVAPHLSATWVDDVLADSFPASDPPSWTPGMARPAPTHQLNKREAASLDNQALVGQYLGPDDAGTHGLTGND